MSGFGSIFGSGRFRKLPASSTPIEMIVVQRELQNILAYTGFTIDDVVNNPVARNAVIGYFKLSKEITRRGEVLDLERQWNRA